MKLVTFNYVLYTDLEIHGIKKCKPIIYRYRKYLIPAYRVVSLTV